MRKVAALLAFGWFAAAPVMAAPVLYGEAHLSVNKFSQLSDGELRMESHNSLIGLKGSEDLDHGVKLIYKVEFGYDTTEQKSDATNASTDKAATFTDRDQWVGFASQEWGVIRLGTVSTGYKSSGAALDPLYNTVFEQRGYLGMQSSLHAGNSVDGGRSTNTMRIDTITRHGLKLTGSYSLGEQKKNTKALGVRYERDGLKLNFDYLDSRSKDATALKFGLGYAVTPQLRFSLQHESADSVLFDGGVDAERHALDLGVIDAVYKVDMSYIMGNSAWVLAYGVQSSYSRSYLLAWNYKCSPKSDIYAGYGNKSFDRRGVSSDAIFAFGLRHKF